MEILSALLGFLSAFFIGFFFVSSFAKNTDLHFRVLFAIPLGFGITSLLYFVFMVLNIYDFRLQKVAELFLIILFGVFYFRNPYQTPPKKPQFSWALTLSSLFGSLIFLRFYLNETLGGWDGFRIWNIKAEFLYQYDSLWKRVFQLPHYLMHNDYPLFLPASTARLWKYAGVDSADINVMLGLIFTLATIFLLYFTIKKFKSETLAAVVSSIYALCAPFQINGASQAADIPLAYIMLCAVVCLFLYFAKKRKRYIILGTVFAALAAWTKNEGLLFLFVYSLVFSGYFIFRKKYRQLIYIAIPAFFGVLILAFFKNLAKAPNDIFEGMMLTKSYLHIFDMTYYVKIIKEFGLLLLFRFNILFLYLLLAIGGLNIKKELIRPLTLTVLIAVLMSAGYFTVYLVSPHDLHWLMKNSADRIMLQILPIWILAYAFSLKLGSTEK